MRAREFILENKVHPNIEIEWDSPFIVTALDGQAVEAITQLNYGLTVSINT